MPTVYHSIKNLQHNLDIVKKHSTSKILAMLSNNAYGFGLQQASFHLHTGVDGFGVYSIYEAITLHRYCKCHSKQLPIFVFDTVMSEQEIKFASEYGFVLVISSLKQINAILSVIDTHRLRRIRIWLQLDLNNGIPFGLNEKDSHTLATYCGTTNSAFQLLGTTASLRKVKNYPIEQQVDFYNRMLKHPVLISLDRSLCDSQTVLDKQDYHYEWIRPGVMLTGNLPHDFGNKYNLMQTTQLVAQISAIRHYSKGELLTHKRNAHIDVTMAILNCGYANGYPVGATSTPVYIPKTNRVIKSSLLDIVFQNYMLVDVSSVSDVKLSIGDDVVLLGHACNTIDSVAALHEIQSSVLLSGISNPAFSVKFCNYLPY